MRTALRLAGVNGGFSALQRAEIAEIRRRSLPCVRAVSVSVLFNEPKLLKCRSHTEYGETFSGFSALQRAEIAEIVLPGSPGAPGACFSALQRAEIAEIVIDEHVHQPSVMFQCSSTSRNC